MIFGVIFGVMFGSWLGWSQGKFGLVMLLCLAYSSVPSIVSPGMSGLWRAHRGQCREKSGL